MPANPQYFFHLETTSGTFVDFSESCMRASIERTVCNAETPLAAGAATFVLDNHHGHFSPSNTAGDYYPNIRPGRRAHLVVRHVSDGFDFIKPNACIAMWMCTSLTTDLSSGTEIPDLSGWARPLKTTGDLSRSLATSGSGVSKVGPFTSANTGAILMNATDSYFNYGTNDFYVAFWTNPGSSFFDRYAFVYSFYDNGGGFLGPRIGIYSVGGTNKMRMRVTTSGTALSVYNDVDTVTNPSSTANNYFFVFQRNGSNIEAYCNGELEATTALTNPSSSMSNESAQVIIGRNWSTTTRQYAMGTLFGMRVGRNAHITGQEIRRIYEHEKYMCNPSTTMLFKGRVKQVSVQPVMGPRTVTLDAEDELAKVFDVRLNVPLLVDTYLSSLFTTIMSECNVSSFQLTSNAGNILPYVALDDIGADSVLNQIAQEGLYEIDNDTNNTINLRGSYYGNFYVGSYHNSFFDFSYAETDRSIVNKLRLSASARAAATSPSTLAWIDADTITVDAGTSKEIWLNYVDPNDTAMSVPAINVTTPVPTTDYTFFTAIGGGGSNYTATSSVDFYGFASSAKLTIHNHGASTMYANRLQVRGTPVIALPKYSVVTENASSQSFYGLHEATEEHTLMTSENDVDQLSLSKLTRRKEPKPEVSFSLKNIFPAVFAHELQDLVRLKESNTGIDNQYYIIGINHDINTQGGLEHVARYTVESD